MNDDYIAAFTEECLDLYHYGILGQKWGIRNYQYSDGSLTPAGKRRYGSSNYGSLRSKSKSPLTEEQRKKSIEDVDLKTINAHKREYTNKELQDVMNRVNLEKNVRNATLEESTRSDALDKYAKTMKQTVYYVGAGLITYNTLARVYNATHVGDVVSILPGKLPSV